jgi:hypothetical protein
LDLFQLLPRQCLRLLLLHQLNFQFLAALANLVRLLFGALPNLDLAV